MILPFVMILASLATAENVRFRQTETPIAPETGAAINAIAATATSMPASASARKETMDPTVVTSCESRYSSFRKRFPTEPKELATLTGYTGDPCTTSVPSSLYSVMMEYEASMLSVMVSFSSKYNSFVLTDCPYLAYAAMYEWGNMVVGTDCESVRKYKLTTSTSTPLVTKITVTTTTTPTALGASATASTAVAASANSLVHRRSEFLAMVVGVAVAAGALVWVPLGII